MDSFAEERDERAAEGIDEDATSKAEVTAMILCDQHAAMEASKDEESAMAMVGLREEKEVQSRCRGRPLPHPRREGWHAMVVARGRGPHCDRVKAGVEVVLPVAYQSRCRVWKDLIAAGRLGLDQGQLPCTNLVVLWAGNQKVSFCVSAKVARFVMLDDPVFRHPVADLKTSYC